jgi:hypothetical protein
VVRSLEPVRADPAYVAAAGWLARADSDGPAVPIEVPSSSGDASTS